MMNLTLVAGAIVAVLLAVTGLFVLVRAGSHRSREASIVESDPWEEAMLAASGATAAAPVEPAQVLRRESLLGERAPFDPDAWDDRPDGCEGTDMGLVGGPDDHR